MAQKTCVTKVEKRATGKVNVVVKGPVGEFSNSEKIGKGKYWHSGERSTWQLFSKRKKENQKCLPFFRLFGQIGRSRQSFQQGEKIYTFSHLNCIFIKRILDTYCMFQLSDNNAIAPREMWNISECWQTERYLLIKDPYGSDVAFRWWPLWLVQPWLALQF